MRRCLYNGCENLGAAEAKLFLGASTTMELQYLTAKCIQAMRSALNAENYLSVKLDAIASGNETLIKMIDFEVRNSLDGIFKSKAFNELPIEKVMLQKWFNNKTKIQTGKDEKQD